MSDIINEMNQAVHAMELKVLADGFRSYTERECVPTRTTRNAVSSLVSSYGNFMKDFYKGDIHKEAVLDGDTLKSLGGNYIRTLQITMLNVFIRIVELEVDSYENGSRITLKKLCDRVDRVVDERVYNIEFSLMKERHEELKKSGLFTD